MGGSGYLDVLGEFLELTGLKAGDTIFFMADRQERAAYYAGMISTELGEKLGLLEEHAFRFCYVNDFPKCGKFDVRSAVHGKRAAAAGSAHKNKGVRD